MKDQVEYEVVEGWDKLPDGWVYTQVAGVSVDARDRVYVLNRGEHPIIVYEKDGSFIGSWGEGMFQSAHGAYIDDEDHIYCVDRNRHVLWKFTTDGELLMTIGNLDEQAPGNPDIEADYAWIDAWSYWAIMRPDRYDVVVMPNQYGDIMSDMSGALQGSMGMAGSINAGDRHCFAEATHGSAPDIAGRGIANPTSIILSVGMMLNWLGKKRGDGRLKDAWKGIDKAVDDVLIEGRVRTPDLGGKNRTHEFGDAVAKAITGA